MTPANLRPVLAAFLALRSLARDPGATLLAASVLGLGIAAPATFFSVLVGAVRPLPVPEGDRVVRVDVLQPAREGRPLPVTVGDLEALRGAASLEALGGYRLIEGTVVDRERAAARFSGAVLTPDVLPLLRVAPVLGRIPSQDEAETTLLLGHRLWQDLYQGDPSALGRAVEANGEVRVIVGVLPEGFGFPLKQDAWLLTPPGEQGPVELVGRLAPGATLRAAAAELGARWGGGDGLRDADATGGVVRVRPFTRGRGEGGEAVAFGGLVLVGLCLLLIACANVANLLLVRATERVRALAVQAALGAGRAQLATQLLLESLMVSAVGGAAGLLLAWVAVGALQRGLSEEHFGYFWMRMAVDGPVLAFVGGLVALTALVSGVIPAARVAGVDIQRVLKEGGDGGAVGGGGAWSRAFVTLQLALSCGALVAAGLTGRALAGVRHFGEGVPAGEVLTASVGVGGLGGGSTPADALAALESTLAGLGGARGAAVALGAPGYGERFTRVEVEGEEPRAGAEGAVIWNAVTPGFFGALDLELRAGRFLEAADGAGGAPVAVVSEDFVRRHASGTPMLGRRVRLVSSDTTVWLTVVGVVEDAPVGAGAQAREDRVYVSLGRTPVDQAMVIVRGRGDVASLAADLRRAVAGVSPEAPVWGVRTLADGHAYMTRVPRVLAGTAVAGGIAGLLVAAAGLYGLLAFRVRQRRREMGVRLAVGADGRRLALEVMATALRQLAPAVVVGLALAWLASPVLSAFLLGTPPRSAAVYVGVATAFLGVGLASALLPALRAASVDPARVLRGE